MYKYSKRTKLCYFNIETTTAGFKIKFVKISGVRKNSASSWKSFSAPFVVNQSPFYCSEYRNEILSVLWKICNFTFPLVHNIEFRLLSWFFARFPFRRLLFKSDLALAPSQQSCFLLKRHIYENLSCKNQKTSVRVRPISANKWFQVRDFVN